MTDPYETSEQILDLASQHCLQRTRSAVLNVLVAVSAVVAVSGFLLRGRQAGDALGGPAKLNQQLFFGLVAIFLASTLLRRSLGSRSRLRDPDSRDSRFYWAHLVPAIVGGLAAPLGLVYGWLVSPRIEAILPFWIAALVLGILAYPRGYELEDFDQPMTPSRELAG